MYWPSPSLINLVRVPPLSKPECRSLAGETALECTPMVIIECSVCICIESVWKGAFCWLTPGVALKKSKAQTKERVQKTRPVALYSPSSTGAPHTNPSWWSSGSGRNKGPCKRERKRRSAPLLFPPSYSPAMRYGLGCIIHGTLIRPKERCPRLVSLPLVPKHPWRLGRPRWPHRARPLPFVTY